VWKYFPNENTASQFLCAPTEPPLYGAKPLMLKDFKDANIDILMPTINVHERTFFDLRNSVRSKAKLIRQTGNVFDHIDYNIIDGVLSSCYHIPENDKCVFYHQEFDLNEFCYADVSNKPIISNFLHYLKGTPDYPLWNQYKSVMQNVDWKMFGCGGDLGASMDIAKDIKNSSMVWHLKRGGDGFGYAVHYSAACGRPIITKGSCYRGKTAGLLMEDGVTSIDLEKRNFEENCKLWTEILISDKIKQMSENMYKRFKEVVNFDAEVEKIKKFMERII
jgi:hypothetical protein